jgi:tRNA(fMet)-specific endonuclease VapC
MVCADTDFLIAWLQNSQDALKKLEELELCQICTTAITAFELYKGVYRSKRKESEINRVAELLDLVEILVLDSQSARLAGRLEFEMKSHIIGESDLLIASIVLAQGETLLTRNRRHFERVPGLKIESW